jgi:hypothetical protein
MILLAPFLIDTRIMHGYLSDRNVKQGVMNPEQLHGELENLFIQLGIEIRHDALEETSTFQGGLCKVNSKTILIVNHTLNLNQKNNMIIRSLQSLDTEGIYIKPYVRELIEGRMTPLP